MADKRPALGKGLSALIPDAPEPRFAPTELDVDLLQPNPLQPRAAFNEAGLDALAQSIRTSGVIQPIIVRRTGDRYQIIAGERRWRAAQRAGLLKAPVVIREVHDDRRLLEQALIENVQREDLNPIDEARAYRRLGEEFGLSQDQIASRVGKERSTVANLLRLLKLPSDVQAALGSGALTMGHARALLSITDETTLRRIARDVVSRRLTVRDVEALVRRLTSPESRRATAAPTDVHTRDAEERLRRALGARVRIVRGRQGGRLEIAFASEDELQQLFERLTGE